MNYPLKNGIMMTKEEKIEFLESEVNNLIQACTERAQERDRACRASNEWQEKLDFATSTFGRSLLKVEEEKEKLKEPRVEVWMLFQPHLDWADLFYQGDTHIGPLWGLSPWDVSGKEFSIGAIEALEELNPRIPENTFAVTFNFYDLEWESGEPDCGLPSGWMMKAEVKEFHFNAEEEGRP